MARKLIGSLLMAAFALAGVAAADGLQTALSDHQANRAIGDLADQAAVLGMAKSEVDTVFLLGGPDAMDGTFETAAGQPDWHGWTSEDFTNDETYAWNISTDPNYVIDGDRTMVCGVDWERPDGSTDFGYGNGWYKYLVFTHDVPDPDQPMELRITATIRIYTEPDYDYVYLQVKTSRGWEEFSPESNWDDRITRPMDIDFTMSLLPSDYVGPGNSQVQMRFYFFSDIGWSDEDGQYDSEGACHLDNVTVYMDGNPVDYEDFEDGVSDYWVEQLSGGVGDYVYIYSNLQDNDPCRSNASPQVAFIDDGVVVPGTGGSSCVTYCYGPDGYVVNHTGGLLGTDAHIENGLKSPILAWPDDCDAVQLGFSVYRHEEMLDTSTGVFYRWFVRSTTSENPADIELAEWQTNNSFYWGAPSYWDGTQNLTTYVEPGRQWVQVMLMAHEFGWYWDINGYDGTPAPYFDNIRVFAYPFTGPGITSDALFLASDNFPEQGDFDFANMASNSIRFDCCYNISPATDLRNDPGDSLTISVAATRSGAVLAGLPEMKVRMKANPLFDPYRVLPPGFTQTGGIITGAVLADSVYFNEQLVEDRYAFDLPDTGFFYPGDVIHYYFEARDNQAGDIGVTLLPGDTTGFASFVHDLQFPSDFICRGLPSLQSASLDDQPKILLWNDFANRGGENEWYFGLLNCGLAEGIGYDIYYTNRPDGGEGNGLGGRATSALLDGYDILLYTCGDLAGASLGNGDYASEASRDVQVVSAWLARGGKNALFTGDDLIFDLTQKGSEALALINNYFGIEFIDRSVEPFIEQTAPLVRIIPGNGVISSVDEWIAYGGCLGINTFDAVETRGTAVRLAEFTDDQGNSGVHDYAAGVYNYNESSDAEVIYLPYDFMWVYGAPGYTPPPGLGGVSARGIMLRDILNFFGLQLEGPDGVDDTPSLGVLTVSSYPNPFNPRATIELSLPRSSQVSVKIYNVRGELVRTLQDGALAAGVHELVWDGRDRSGAASASGVYFAETRALDQTRVTRMAMVK